MFVLVRSVEVVFSDQSVQSSLWTMTSSGDLCRKGEGLMASQAAAAGRACSLVESGCIPGDWEK